MVYLQRSKLKIKEMTIEQEDRVYWTGESENYCKVKQPFIFKIKYLLFYLSFRGKLDWKNSWFKKRSEGFNTNYSSVLLSSTMNYSFKKISNCDKYDTKLNYIGDLFLSTTLENYKDLEKFCGKKFITKNDCRLIKTPTKYEFLKHFYPELWTIKHKGATLYFNIFNQLIKKENTEQLDKDFWDRVFKKLKI